MCRRLPTPRPGFKTPCRRLFWQHRFRTYISVTFGTSLAAAALSLPVLMKEGVATVWMRRGPSARCLTAEGSGGRFRLRAPTVCVSEAGWEVRAGVCAAGRCPKAGGACGRAQKWLWLLS